MQTASEVIATDPTRKKESLANQLQQLDERHRSLQHEVETVESEAATLEDQIRELARQEAQLQQRKHELQQAAKEIGQRRSVYIGSQRELDAEREQLRQRLDEVEREQQEDEQLRQQLAAQDAAWHAEREATRQAEQERRAQQEAAAAEKRRHKRLTVALDVSLQTEHNFYMGLTENLSEGGLFIATYEPLPLGTQLDLSLNLPDHPPIKSRCEVRWVREHTEFTNDATPGVGVQFLDLDDQDKQTIRDFLQQRDPILYDAG